MPFIQSSSSFNPHQLRTAVDTLFCQRFVDTITVSIPTSSEEPVIPTTTCRRVLRTEVSIPTSSEEPVIQPQYSCESVAGCVSIPTSSEEPVILSDTCYGRN